VFLHLANLAVSGTGLIYAWMSYLLQPVDEWAVVNHPWQPLVQHLHVLAAPLLVFAIGLIWSVHVLGKLQNGHRVRASGLGLMALFLPMAASGYLQQVAVDPEWRRRWVVIHVISSLLWVGAIVVHQVRSLVGKAADQSGTEVSDFAITANQSTDSSSFAITANQSTDSSSAAAAAGGGRQTSRNISSGTSPATIADSTSAASGGRK
jgi:hypothetical protein